MATFSQLSIGRSQGGDRERLTYPQRQDTPCPRTTVPARQASDSPGRRARDIAAPVLAAVPPVNGKAAATHEGFEKF